MPKLPVYEARETGGVRSTGQQFGADVARARGQAAQEISSSAQNLIGGLYKNKVDRDVSKLQASMATAQADLTVDQQNRLKNADPNDDQWAENFLTTSVDKTLGSIGETAQTKEGQQYFQQASARVRAGFQESSYAHMTELAGIAAVQNAQTTANALSTTVASDPTQFDSVMSQAELNIATMPGLTTEMRLKALPAVQKTLAMSAARSWAKMDPDYADKLVDSGKYGKYLDGEDVIALKSASDTERRARRADASLARQQMLQAREEADNQAQYSANDALVAGTLTAQDVVNDDTMAPETQRVFLNALESRANGNHVKHSDPNTYADLVSRSALDPSDPRIATPAQVRQAMAENRLTPEDAKDIYGIQSGSGDPEKKQENDDLEEFMKGMKGSITKSNPLLNSIDSEGDQRYFDFQRQARKTFQNGRAKGKSTDELLDPRSKDYIGNLATNYVLNKTQFKQTLDKYMTGGSVYRGEQALVEGVTPPAEPAKKKSLDEIWGAK